MCRGRSSLNRRDEPADAGAMIASGCALAMDMSALLGSWSVLSVDGAAHVPVRDHVRNRAGQRSAAPCVEKLSKDWGVEATLPTLAVRKGNRYHHGSA